MQEEVRRDCLEADGCLNITVSHLYNMYKNSINCFFLFYIEPVHEISNNVVCATSKASDQPAHTRSLLKAFASRLSIL